MDAPKFKAKFIERYSQLTDFDAFAKSCLTHLPRFIRVNTLKISVDALKKRLSENWNLIPVPWCKEGFKIEHKRKERRDIGNLREHMLGYFYVQEAASMIPPIVLDPKPGETVLDLCAAPGSKTSQIAAMMQNKGVIVANDYKGERMAPLDLNISRSGVVNCITTLMHGESFRDMRFDKILVDAPCSGTGTIRKSLKTLLIWNPNMVKKIAKQQRRLLETAFALLRPGGTLVYSTCSLEPEEDEGVISDFIQAHGSEARIDDIDLNIKRGKPVTEIGKKKLEEDVRRTLRVWPQDNDTEGFFVAKIRKLKTESSKV